MHDRRVGIWCIVGCSVFLTIAIALPGLGIRWHCGQLSGPNGQSVAQDMQCGSMTVTHLTGLRHPEGRIDASGVATWYIFDGLGSVVGEANGSGTITASRKLDVYGLLREAEVGTPTSDHKFVGGLGQSDEHKAGWPPSLTWAYRTIHPRWPFHSGLTGNPR